MKQKIGRMIKSNIKYILYIIVLGILCIFAICNMKLKDVFLYGESIQAEQPIGGIYFGNVLEQEIECKRDTFDGFAIRFGTYGRENHILVRITLLEGDKELYRWEFGGESLKDNAYTGFELPEKINNSKGKIYVVRIESSSVDGSNSITVYSTLEEEQIDNDYLYNSGVLPEGTLAIKTICGKIDADIIKIVVCFVVFIIFTISIICGQKNNWSIQKKYLLMVSIIGIVYLIVLPFGIGPDERNHLLRIFEISEGYIVSDKLEDGAGGRTMASNLAPVEETNSVFDVSTYWNTTVDYENEQEYEFGNTALYSPVSYSAQVITLSIGKLFSDRFVALVYCVKVAGFLFCVFMIYFALKYIPVKKESMLMISFLPMFIHQSVVISADGFLNALTSVFIAYVLYLTYGYNDKLTKVQIVFLYLLPCIIGLSKIVYLPVCLLLFMIPSERFKSKKSCLAIVISAFTLTCIVNLSWLAISSGYLFEIREGVNGTMQVEGILSNPLNYLNVIYNTVLQKYELVFWQFFGDGLGRLSIPINRVGYYFYAGLMLIFAVSDGEVKIHLKQRLIMLLAAIGTILLICTSEYVQWTKVGAEVIDGIQGRYFIPIAILLMIAMGSSVIKIDKKNLQKYLFPFLAYINVFALITCINNMMN